MPLAASGPVELRLSGAAYLADLQPTLTGADLRITRQEPPFNYSEGALAKQVALQFCAGRGQRLDPRAMGQFIGDYWRFDGGCL